MREPYGHENDGAKVVDWFHQLTVGKDGAECILNSIVMGAPLAR